MRNLAYDKKSAKKKPNNTNQHCTARDKATILRVEIDQALTHVKMSHTNKINRKKLQAQENKTIKLKYVKRLRNNITNGKVQGKVRKARKTIDNDPRDSDIYKLKIKTVITETSKQQVLDQ